MDTETIKELVKKNRMHDFYGSSEWQALARLARAEQHDECQRCKARGYYVPCEVVHHKEPVKDAPERALDIDNLECLCRECHEEIHKAKGNSFMNEERW